MSETTNPTSETANPIRQRFDDLEVSLRSAHEDLEGLIRRTPAVGPDDPEEQRFELDAILDKVAEARAAGNDLRSVRYSQTRRQFQREAAELPRRLVWLCLISLFGAYVVLGQGRLSLISVAVWAFLSGIFAADVFESLAARSGVRFYEQVEAGHS